MTIKHRKYSEKTVDQRYLRKCVQVMSRKKRDGATGVGGI